MLQETILQNRIENDKLIISVRHDGIIHVCYKQGVTITSALLLELHVLYVDACQGGNPPFLFSFEDYVSITKDGRERAKTQEKVFPGCAIAVLADTVAYQLMANFYLKVNRPNIPTLVFKDSRKAIEWLRTFVEQGS
jgi:hypothetical protein